MSLNKKARATVIRKEWETNPRWDHIKRNYTAEQVVDLQGSAPIEYSLAQRGANKLWMSLLEEPYVATLGALTGMQALQQVKAGLQGIYLSGWPRCDQWQRAQSLRRVQIASWCGRRGASSRRWRECREMPPQPPLPRCRNK